MAYPSSIRHEAVKLRKRGYLKRRKKKFDRIRITARSSAPRSIGVSFTLDESKFHPCIHLYSYHSPEKQLDFWSKVTDIDKQQFIKPYLKPNTGKRIHENYQGCISLRYFNNDLARQRMAVAKAYLSQ